MEGLSLIISQARSQGLFYGFKVARGLPVTRILFVNDVLIVGDDLVAEWAFLQSLLSCFCKASDLKVSEKKSVLLYSCYETGLKDSLLNLFPYNFGSIEEGFKYLGFIIKPNGYGPKDWEWMLKVVSKKINCWVFCYLSLEVD